MYEVASPDRVRDSLTRFLRVQLRPELSERATATRLPSLRIHIGEENNFKFWADSRQLQKMLRAVNFDIFWWSRFMTLRCWEALDSRLSCLLGPTWPGLRPRSHGAGARSARLRVPSFVSSLARQSRVSLCRELGCYTGHVNCEQSQASENHECSLQVNNNQFWPSSLWSTITSSVPENYTNMGDPLFYYDIKIMKNEFEFDTKSYQSWKNLSDTWKWD